jgi:hypothetical protein
MAERWYTPPFVMSPSRFDIEDAVLAIGQAKRFS